MTPPTENKLSRAWLHAYRADVPDAAQVRRAYARFAARRALTSVPRLGRSLLVGLAFGASVAFAATGAPLQFLLQRYAAKTPSPAASAPNNPQKIKHATPVHPVALGAAARAATTSSSAIAAAPPSAAFAMENEPTPAAHAVGAPGERVHAGPPAQPAKQKTPAPWGDAHAGTTHVREPRRAPAAVAAAAVTPGLQASRTSSDAWQRAARGLREKDLAAANAALLQVEDEGSSSEREAARLARAELFLSDGQLKEATFILKSLAAGAESELVRSRARELLQRAEATR